MCANYTPVTREERLRAGFATGHPVPYPKETWPGYPAEALEAEPAPRPPARRGRAQVDPTTPSLI